MSEQTQTGSPSAGRLGLIGRKVGMTRIFTAEGESVPVTVLDVSDNRIAQVRTVDADGYNAVQVAFGKRRASRVVKPLAGHYAKAGVEAGEVLKEFRVDAEFLEHLARFDAGLGVVASQRLDDTRGPALAEGHLD